jgi:hypothetical protein
MTSTIPVLLKGPFRTWVIAAALATFSWHPLSAIGGIGSVEETSVEASVPTPETQNDHNTAVRSPAVVEPTDTIEAPSTPRTPMTAEEARAAIAEAEKRRLEKMSPDPAVAPDTEVGKQLKEKWGVEVIGVNLTSGGYMLDFRFRVLEVDKALPLFDHRIKPVVVTHRGSVTLPVPMAAKVGGFRPTNRGKNIKADKNYYIVFANPDHFLNVGDKVNVVIGDFRADNLTLR